MSNVPLYHESIPTVEPRTESIETYRQVASAYLDNHAPQADEYLSYLHESDHRHEVPVDQRPDYGIFIPIAANEAEDNIRGVLDAIIEHPFQKPEVVLYGNYTKDTSAEERAALNDHLDRILNDYRGTPAFSALRSVVAPAHYYHDFSMVQLRKEAIDMLAADALKRKLPFNYPIVSLDADALKISSTTLRSLVAPIENEGVTLTHGDSNFGYRDLPDNASARLAVTAEILRRTEIRQGAAEDPYPEESCTAISLGAYCMAEGYPPLIQNDYDKSNLISETPILIRRFNKMLQENTYSLALGSALGEVSADIAPRHVDGAVVTRNGRRNLEYFAAQLAKAESNPADFADTTRLLQEVMRANPTLDRHISTGGAYNEGFDSHEEMRQDNGLFATRIAPSNRAVNLVLSDYFGPERMKLIGPTSEQSVSTDPKLRLQQLVLKRYFGE